LPLNYNHNLVSNHTHENQIVPDSAYKPQDSPASPRQRGEVINNQTIPRFETKDSYTFAK